MVARLEQRRLSLAYAAYLGGTALLVTYFPMYFRASGLSGKQIGVLFSVQTMLSIVLQPVLGYWTDRRGAHGWMVRLCFVWTATLPVLFLFARDFWSMALVMWAMALLSTSIPPLLDAAIVLGVGAECFGRVRLWGSVGYGVVVLAFGVAMRGASDAVVGMGAIVCWFLVLVFGVWAVWRMPFRRGTSLAVEGVRAARVGWFPDWLSARLLVLLLINALHWWGITSFNIYISLHVADQGMRTTVTGFAAASAIVGEVLAFALARRFVRAGAAHRMLPWVFISGAIRWWITAWAVSPVVLVIVQLLHFLGYGVWMVALIHMIGRYVEPEHRTAAQGLMGGLTCGVGGMLGNWVSGWMFDLGGGELVFKVSAFADIIALVCIVMTWRLWLSSPRVERPALNSMLSIGSGT